MNYYESIETVLIICPASLKINWSREFKKWSVRDFTIAIADPDIFPPADVVIINYEILPRWAEKIRQRKWGLLVCDESHRIKSKSSIRTVQVVGGRYRSKGEAFKVTPIEAEKKLFLSGTPIPNRPYEIFTTLKYLRPDQFPRQWTFIKNYCNGEFTGHSNLAEMQYKLRSTLMIRRKKEDVLPELPPKRRQIIPVEVKGSTKVVKAELEAWERHEARIEGLTAAVELAKADSEAEYLDKVDKLDAYTKVAFEDVANERKAVALAKVPAVIEHVRSIVAEGQKVVVFVYHHEVCDKIYDAFKGHAVTLDGRLINKEKRQARIDKFQDDPECRVFIGSIGAAGVGITLTAASIVVFAELDWVPGNISQAEDRCHRIGQEDSVLVHHLVIDGSLDGRMCKILVEKQEVIDAALDDQIVTETDIPNWGNRNTTHFTKTPTQIEKESLLIIPEQSKAIHSALSIVATYCDGAVTQDSAGFSRIDAEMGHSLANQTELTPKAAALGKYLVKKYRRQIPGDLLELCGIELPTRPEKIDEITGVLSPRKQSTFSFEDMPEQGYI